MRPLFDHLTPEQREIVETEDGPVMVIAGPGTGKTKTLTSRVAYLLDQGIAADKIITLTFTKKAAAEMQERLAALVAGPLPTVTTFHGFAYDYLVHTKGPISIIAEPDRLKLVAQLLKQHNLSMSVKDASLFITNEKNKGIRSDALVSSYNNALSLRSLYDYDDLILLVSEHLQTDTSMPYSHILVDEFQDTNKLQYHIVRKLANETNNIFVIGDPNQSIYAFRGANADIFDQLSQDYPATRQFQLTKNFRSDQKIVRLSNQLMPGTAIAAASKDDGLVQLITTGHARAEADWVVNQIETLVGGTNMLSAKHTEDMVNFGDIAIIYRAHHLAGTIQQRLQTAGFLIQKIGEDTPYETAQIAFICNLLKFLATESLESLLSLLHSPLINLSQDTIDLMISDTDPVTMCLDRYGQDPILTAKERSKIQSLQDKVAEIRSISQRPLSFMVSAIIDRWSLASQAQPIVHDNLQQFLSTVIHYDQFTDGRTRFLAYYDFLQAHEFYDPTADKVTLATIHAAKGLEFPIVFLLGFEDGNLPLLSKKPSRIDIDEEKRLLYVAMTRAKQRLYLIRALERNKKPTTISRFYKEIAGDKLEEVTDEAIAKEAKRKELWRKKHQQIELF